MIPVRPVRWLILVAVALVLTAACGPAHHPGARHGSPGAQRMSAAHHTSAPHTSAPTRRTTSPPPPSSAPPPPASPTPDGARVPVADPATVVSRYIQAINGHDYQRAWNLLGAAGTGQNYQDFVSGFAGTDHDVLTVDGVSGGTVQVHLDAYQTDGSVDVYAGTYTVRGGVIVGAHLERVSGSSTCGAPSNPWNYTFCHTGRLVDRPPAEFCDYFRCIANFPNGRGYVVQCEDATFSASGGIDGACSYHSGVRRALYAPTGR